jgi:hypothetical protein
MEWHTAKERRVKVTSPDGNWWVNVWFRTDGGDRIQIDLPAGRWVLSEARVPADGRTQLVLRSD